MTRELGKILFQITLYNPFVQIAKPSNICKFWQEMEEPKSNFLSGMLVIELIVKK